MHFHILSIALRPALLEPILVAVSVFSPCQAFESFVRFRPLVQLRSNPHNLIMHPMQFPIPHYVTPALPAIGSSLRGYFAIVRHLAITLSASATACAAVLPCSRVSILLVVIGYISVLPALLCFCDKPSPYLLTFLPSPPEPHTASHTRDKLRRLSMRPTDLNTFFQCLCFVNPHYTS